MFSPSEDLVYNAVKSSGSVVFLMHKVADGAYNGGIRENSMYQYPTNT